MTALVRFKRAGWYCKIAAMLAKQADSPPGPEIPMVLFLRSEKQSIFFVEDVGRKAEREKENSEEAQQGEVVVSNGSEGPFRQRITFFG